MSRTAGAATTFPPRAWSVSARTDKTRRALASLVRRIRVTPAIPTSRPVNTTSSTDTRTNRRPSDDGRRQGPGGRASGRSLTTRSPTGADHAVTDPPHRANEFLVQHKFGAHLRHVHVDGARAGGRGAAPDPSQQLIPAEHLPRVAGQRGQQIGTSVVVRLISTPSKDERAPLPEIQPHRPGADLGIRRNVTGPPFHLDPTQ